MATIKAKSLQQQANEILAQAEQKGVQTNFFFVTTFKRYQVQMKTLKELEHAITEKGAMLPIEYGTGRKNLTVNPAVTEYNKTATAANGTVATLINIIKTVPADDGGKGLAEIMAGLMAGE